MKRQASRIWHQLGSIRGRAGDDLRDEPALTVQLTPELPRCVSHRRFCLLHAELVEPVPISLDQSLDLPNAIVQSRQTSRDLM